MRLIPYDPNPDFNAIREAALNPDTPATEVGSEFYYEMLGAVPPTWQRYASAPTQFAMGEEFTDSADGPVVMYLARVGAGYYAKYGVMNKPETLIGYNADTTPYKLEKSRIPTVDEIVAAFSDQANADTAGYVVQMPENTIVEPREVWLPSIGAWVKINGMSASFDQARGTQFYTEDERAKLVRAYDEWIVEHPREGRAA